MGVDVLKVGKKISDFGFRIFSRVVRGYYGHWSGRRRVFSPSTKPPMGVGVEKPLKPFKTGLEPLFTGYLLGRPHFERSEIVWDNLKWKTSGPKKKCAACASLRLVILRSLLESQGASSIFRVGIEACKSRVFAYFEPILRGPLLPASGDLWNTQNFLRV